ncbi:unnamed protein product [Adineta ricciae]|uniref:Uncharacterized protein n=1 Tax=Adineta ricciae TaxID=249248 RepID=A0A816HAD9_ADIRI|nr:unnamed protein product [Adineta ricciae]CAF1684015.1 unnamed protein product [Adineta ricciae]
MHTTSLLPNGKVLVAGGYTLGGPHSSTELYDPLTGNWLLTGSMNVSRYQHTASVLSNGKVLVSSGFTDDETFSNSSELYDPMTGTWKFVAITGAFNESPDVFGPSTETWTTTSSMYHIRWDHRVVTLPNENILVVGNSRGSSSNNSAGLYNSSVKSF